MWDGKYDQYYMENHHEAIVTREEWNAVQIELARREKFREDHHLGVCSCKTGDPFFAKVFCGKCGGRINRTKYRGIREPVYKCCNSKKAGTCDPGITRESTLRELVVDVWNDIVAHQDQYQDHWNRMIEEGDALEKLTARQMKALVKEGPFKTECLKMTKMILREITVMDSMNFRVVLMDGTEKTVCMALGA